MLFWIIVAALAIAVTALMVLALVNRTEDGPSATEIDIAVYRDQLREVDRDLERGVITPEVAERTRLEVSRRILDADRRRAGDHAGAAPPWLTWTAAAAVAIFTILGSLVLYRDLGAPGYGDLPLQARLEASEIARTTRPSQADAEDQVPARLAPQIDPDYAELVDQLRAAVADRPGDAQGLRLLVRNEAALGNLNEAHGLQDQLIASLGPAATAADHVDHADLLIMAAGGYISPEAEDALDRALAIDPRNGAALYYTGLLNVQIGRFDIGFSIWRQLLETSPGDAPWMPIIRDQILDVAQAAGIRYELPPEPSGDAPFRGPTEADIAAAGQMSLQDRMAMIEGMVSSLSDRLATEGGPPEDWARLVVALGVLGRTAQAQAVLAEARVVFADNRSAQDALNAAAEQVNIP